MRPKPFHVPNVRKIFIPDPGKLIFDMDLIGADATVAAKECGGKYWEAVSSGRKINLEILEHCWPDVYKRWLDGGKKDVDREPQYTKSKNLHYGTIYTGKPAGIGSAASIPVGIVAEMQPWFFSLFPEVKDWHRRTDFALQTTGVIRNAFGFRVVYFDRPEGLLPEAVNWICQSTVAVVCQRGSLVIRREFPEVQLLLQVHDSLVGQVAIELAPRVLPRLLSRLNAIPVPYEQPLFIKWSMKASKRSWGECNEEEIKRLLKDAA